MTLMDPHTSEKLFKLAAVALTLLCLALAAGAIGMILAAFPATLAMAESSAWLSDGLGREGGYTFFYLSADPPASVRFPQWFWVLDGGRLVDSPTGRSGLSVYRYASLTAANNAVRSRVNPYAGSARCAPARAWSFPSGTSLELFDTALFDRDPAAFLAAVDRAVADGRPVGYLHTRHYKDFEKLKDRIDPRRRGPHLVAARPAGLLPEPETAVWMLDKVRGYMRARPSLVTDDAELARAAEQKDYQTRTLSE